MDKFELEAIYEDLYELNGEHYKIQALENDAQGISKWIAKILTHAHAKSLEVVSKIVDFHLESQKL